MNEYAPLGGLEAAYQLPRGWYHEHPATLVFEVSSFVIGRNDEAVVNLVVHNCLAETVVSAVTVKILGSASEVDKAPLRS